MERKAAIIMPALNEAAMIGPVIERAKEVYSVIVVDDGSTDNTAEISQNSGAIVLKLEQNVGYDMAITHGLVKAIESGFAVAVTFDADGQHSDKNIRAIVEPVLTEQADLCIGIRPKTARLAELLFRIYAKSRYGVSDILCGFKAYNLSFIAPFISVSRHPSMGTGLTLAALRRGARLAQIPILLKERKDVPRLGRALKANHLIFKAMIADIFNSYGSS